MRHFINKSKKILVATNYKVMCSQLDRSNNLEELSRHQPLLYKIRNPFINHYMVVRNPYDRIASFYKDKFGLGILRSLMVPGHRIQECQKIFYPYLGLDRNLPLKEIGSMLLAVSFNTMIKYLPNVFHKDTHLKPQHWVNRVTFHKFKSPAITLHPTTIIKMESQTDLRYLAEKLDEDLSTRINTTDKAKLKITYSPEQLRIINQIYQDDFRLYGYTMRQ